jgi:hypothetical protein
MAYAGPGTRRHASGVRWGQPTRCGTKVVRWRRHAGEPSLSLTSPSPLAARRNAQLAARPAVPALTVEIAPSRLPGEGSAQGRSSLSEGP